MKECNWCGKDCPDDEEGGIELDPENKEVEIGWICDHCLLAYDGKCECEECVESTKRADEAVKQYELEHPYVSKTEWLALLCITFPVWGLLILFILVLILHIYSTINP